MKDRQNADQMRGLRGFILAAFVSAAVAVLYLGGGFRVLDNKLLDAKFALFDRPASQDLVIVAIDADSLARFHSWPWPRDYHATVVNHLMQAGAKRVAFDVDFSSTSTKSGDRRFAAALASAKDRVTLAVLKQRRRSTDHAITTEPLPAFKKNTDVAFVSVQPDEDGVIRRMKSRDRWDNVLIPSLPAQLAGIAPTDRSVPGSFYIDYGFDPATIPQISYADVLAGTFDHRLVAGKTVIVGATAVQLGDFLPVPRFGVLPGVEVLSLAYQSLVHGKTLQRLDGIWILAGIFLIAFSLTPLCVRLTWRRGLAALGGAVLLIAAAEIIGFSANLIVDGAALFAAAGLSFIGAIISRSDWQAVLLRVQGREIRHKETMMNGVIHTSLDSIFILDDGGSIHEANDAAIVMFGDDGTRLQGRNIASMIPSARNLIPRDSMHLAPTIGTERSEMIAHRLDGSEFPVEIVTRNLVTETGFYQIAFVHDITERKAHQRALEHQALHDSLTGLPNRAHFLKTMRESIRKAEQSGGPFALLLLDLNRFKEINDTLGHHVGDILLRDIADRLKKPLRRTDMIARLGGDEFAVILDPAPDRAAAERIAERLQQALEAPLHYYNIVLDVGASIGVTVFPEDSTNLDELVQKADIAMYSAKHAAEPLAFYDPAMDKDHVRNLTLSGDLKRAIDCGDFNLHYQPKVDVESRQIVGVESLLRWTHPVYGFVPPDEFVQIAENIGLINKLTEWVLETALAQCARWRAAGHRFSVAVNLSARNLHDEELPKRIEALLAKHRVSPEFLVLEITEGAIMVNPERARAVIQLLHDRGFKLSIDDFGTGYSSLGYLKKLPVNELKIDKSFVLDLMNNEGDRVIVKSTVDLAHNLGLSVVAEGVENAETLDALHTMGANVAQGYFISRPLPADKFAEWLETWQLEHNAPKLRLVAQA